MDKHRFARQSWSALLTRAKRDSRDRASSSSLHASNGPRFHLLLVMCLTGQSLPILAPLLTIDVFWSDKHMEHEDRSLMRYDSFYWAFRTA
jgi:hypothetical protein